MPVHRLFVLFERREPDLPDPIALRFDVPPELIRDRVRIRIILDEALTRAFRAGKGRLDGFKPDAKGGFLITCPKAEVVGLRMTARGQGRVKVEFGPTKSSMHGDITITQINTKALEGGVTLRIASKG